MLISADKTTCMSALSVFQLPDKWQKVRYNYLWFGRRYYREKILKVTKHEVSNITQPKLKLLIVVHPGKKLITFEQRNVCLNSFLWKAWGHKNNNMIHCIS